MSLIYSINNKRTFYNDLFKNEIKVTDSIPKNKIVAQFYNKNFIINCDEDGYGYPKKTIADVTNNIHPNINFDTLFKIYSDKNVMSDTLSIIIKLKLIQIPTSETKKIAIFSFDSGLSKEGHSGTFIVATDSSGIIYTISGGYDNYYNFYDHLEFNKEYCLIFFINRKNTTFQIQKLYVNGEKVGRGVPNISHLNFPTYNILKSFSIEDNREDYIKYKSIDIYDHELTPAEILYHSKCIGHYNTDVEIINNTLYDLTGNGNNLLIDNISYNFYKDKKFFILKNDSINLSHFESLFKNKIKALSFIAVENPNKWNVTRKIGMMTDDLKYLDISQSYSINIFIYAEIHDDYSISIYESLLYGNNLGRKKHFMGQTGSSRTAQKICIPYYNIIDSEYFPITNIQYYNDYLTDEEYNTIAFDQLYISKQNNLISNGNFVESNNFNIQEFYVNLKNIEENKDISSVNFTKNNAIINEIQEI